MKLSAAFIAKLGNSSVNPVGFAEARGVAFHSTRVKKGDVFFALAGEHSHGINFADDALTRGAAFIVSDKPHTQGIVVDNPEQTLISLGKWARGQLACPVIAITGSAGKTSTKSFVSAALEANSSAGNFNTPLALAQTLIAHVLSESKAALVLELGIDHLGEMATLLDLVQPSHGILTSVGPSHLQGLGSIEQVAKETASLFKSGAKAFISSQAEPFVKRYLKTYTTYGLEAAANVSGHLDNDEANLFYKDAKIALPTIGQAMATNALAALALAEHFHIPLKDVVRRFKNVLLEPGRLNFKQQGSLTIIDDSYNSNPLSASLSLDILRKQAAPHIAILGDMLELGSGSHAYHMALGKETKGITTYAIGREAIGILEGNPKAKHYLTVDAFLAHLPELSKGTVLVKASRGMKLEQVVDALMKVQV